MSKLKSARRHLERIWFHTRSSHDLKLFRTATNSYHSAIIRAKKVFNSSLISLSSSDSLKLWNSIKIHSALKSRVTNTSPHIEPSHIPTDLTFFSPATEEEICKLVSQSSNTFCDLDPLPTSLLKHCLPALLPTITNIVNLSLSSGVFPKQFKLSSVIPLLKKYNLDKEDLSNYRPISHLSFISETTQ